MKQLLPWLFPFALLLGCHLPGKPKSSAVPLRPDQVADFHTLYRQNCSACHGADGKGGAAISLANPAYLAYAGPAHVQAVTANGIGGSLMPGFAGGAGGLLTDEQVAILTRGIMAWAPPAQLAAVHPPVYESQAVGDVVRGETLYRQDCLHCHAPGRGSILDPVYLSLVSDGGLRTLTIAGKPSAGMPDWRGYPDGPLTDQQVSDLVSFLVSQRSPALQAAVLPLPSTRKAETHE